MIEYAMAILGKLECVGWMQFVLLGVLLVVANLAYCWNRKKVEPGNIYLSFLVIYLSAVIWITLLSRTPIREGYYNFTPFWSWVEVAREIKTGETYLILQQILYNLIMLFPVGIVLKIMCDISLKKAFWGGFFFSFFIETMQLLFKIGMFEWDDMLHNALGCMIGAWIVTCIKKVSEIGEQPKRQGESVAKKYE